MSMKRLVTLSFVTLAILIASGVSAQELSTNTPAPTAVPTEVTAVAQATTEATASDSAISVPIDESMMHDGNGFEIIEVLIERTSFSIEQVRITVENTSAEALDGVGWYLLAPSSIDEEPWRFATYVAPVELITELAPGEQATLIFAGPGSDLTGEFKLSGWVHRVNEDGTTTHADGIGYDEPLVIGSDLFLTVDSIEWFPALNASNGEFLLYVSFTLWNYSTQPAEIAYSYTLAAPGVEAPWENGVFSMPFQSLILLPGSELRLTSRHIIAIPTDETLEVVGYLQENIEGMLTFRSSYTYPTLIEIAG